MLIASAQNDTYKTFLSLTTSKGLKEQGLFLLSGEKLVREFLKNPTLPIVHELLAPGAEPLTTNVKTLAFTMPLFDSIDVLGTHFNILVLEQPALTVLSAEDLLARKPQGIELVAPVGDPGNLGALIRSAEAFSVPRVILSREAAHPFLPRAVKASAGSVWRLPLARGPALADFPKTCIAMDMQGQDINSFAWPESGYLLLGEEGPGFSAASFPQRVRIPTRGVESLNVVVAASIALSRIPQARA